MIEQVNIAEFTSWVKQQKLPVVILDVRNADELKLASITNEQLQQLGVNLIHIPMRQIEQRLNELDEDCVIACLCHLGVRSQSVAQFLINRDFEQVANIVGGIDAWSLQLDPTIPRYIL